MSEKATAEWTDQCPAKADAGDTYYFVRRKDKLDVVVMGFSMGKGWLNGVSYESDEMRNHLFLGPITPDLFAEVGRLREALEPFAKLIDEIEAAKVQPRDDYLSLCSVYSDGSFWNHGHVNLNDLRSARAALSVKREGEGI